MAAFSRLGVAYAGGMMIAAMQVSAEHKAAAFFEAPLPPAPMRLTPDALAAWLRLASAPGISARVLNRLLAEVSDIEMLFGLPHAALAAQVGAAAAHAVLAPASPLVAGQSEAALKWLETPGQTIVTRHDPAYPPRLRQLHDAPPLLYVRGALASLHRPAIAIVGSRAATPQGLADAAWFAGGLARAGFTIVSGLARGIDGATHEGACRVGGGTVAVLGTGADLVYPADHHELARRIAIDGALLSEWPLGTPARPAHFPQRNRLIAGLALGVLVVEAAPRSGSLITARLANEMGRDVFAIPGSIHAPHSHGCHALIRDGAKLVETIDDVLEEYGLTITPETGRDAPAAAGAKARHEFKSGSTHAPSPSRDDDLSPDARRLLTALGHTPVALDILGNRTGLDIPRLHALMLELELAGQVDALPGGRFARTIRHAPARAALSNHDPCMLQSRAESDSPGHD